MTDVALNLIVGSGFDRRLRCISVAVRDSNSPRRACYLVSFIQSNQEGVSLCTLNN